MASKAGTIKNGRRSSRAPGKRKVDPHSKESPSVVASEPKRKCIEKKSLDGRDIDRYCWMCHQLGQDEKCFTCPRVYHSLCLKKASSAFSKEGVCPECQLDSVDGTQLSKTLTCSRLKELLHAATNQRKKGIPAKELGINKIFFNWPRNIRDDELVRVIDFEILIDKINDIVPYTKTSEFFSDVKWMQHNCFILYGANSKVTDAAIKLVKAFKNDLLDLEACPECYYHMLCYNSDDFFVRLCDPPHDIIWAQVSGYPYWPAKCLKVVNGTAHVRFFGTHQIGNIPTSRCYFITKKHPNEFQKRKAPTTQKYEAAIKEVRQYVDLYERTFGLGSFHYYDGDKLTEFKPENALPKPSKKNTPVSRPSNSKPNIRAIPINIDFMGESSEQSGRNSVPINSNPVAVSMTFSEEQSKGCDFDSSDSITSAPLESTYDAVPPIDIQSCTATTVVDSTPVLATADSDLSDDLSLGAEFSNSNPASQSSVDDDADNHMSHLSKTSRLLLKAVSNINEQMMGNASEITPSGFPWESDKDLLSIFEKISGSSRRCKGCNKPKASKPNSADSKEPIDDDDDITILDSSGPSSYKPRSHIDNSLIVSYLSRGTMLKILNKEFRTMVYSLFINMWTLANNSPAAPEVLAAVILDLKKQNDLLVRLKKDNDALKICADNHQCVSNKLQETINDLKVLLEAEKRKNEDMKVEFNDATRNAKLVVDSVKRSSDNLWSQKFKEYSSICNLKLAEKDNTISDCKEHLERLQTDYNALEAQKVRIENLYAKALKELEEFTSRKKLCASAQTELHSSEVFDRTDLENILEKNASLIKHSMKLELDEQIKAAKRSSHCYICYKPAAIHCCLGACYCSKGCQKKHLAAHSQSCIRLQEGRAHQESEMAHQLNQTQTIARKTTSIHLQIAESSDCVTTTNSEGYVYPPAPPSVSTDNNS